jgi:hypothetical protein
MRNWCLAGCGAASVLWVLVNALEWSLIDVLTPFLFPILYMGIGALFLVSGAWALVAVVWNRKLGYVAALPLVLWGLVAIGVWLTPFTRLWLKANYRWYRSDRQAIVRQVLAGTLRSDAKNLVSLGPKAPYVSVGNNEIVVEEHEGKTYVFFYTFRGILDHAAGFLFVPNGGNPTSFSDFDEANKTRLERIEPEWYFASHW